MPPSCDAQGSVAQLREVWEETDGLDPQEFNPKTFFKLHGGWKHFIWVFFSFKFEMNMWHVICFTLFRYKRRWHFRWKWIRSSLHERGMKRHTIHFVNLFSSHLFFFKFLLKQLTVVFFFFHFKLEKVYDPNNAEDDMMEMEEERLRMREHFMNNVSLQLVCFSALVLIM